MDTELPQVSVIIPTWNGRSLLAACLAALAAQTWRDFAAVVVDNGSTDDTVAWVREHYPDVHVIANGENRGFAAAVNQGIRAIQSRYVVTLNNDTEPEPGWLAALVAAADNDPTVGMCASTANATEWSRRRIRSPKPPCRRLFNDCQRVSTQTRRGRVNGR